MCAKYMELRLKCVDCLVELNKWHSERDVFECPECEMCVRLMGEEE